jgi:hypothetical protein
MRRGATRLGTWGLETSQQPAASSTTSSQQLPNGLQSGVGAAAAARGERGATGAKAEAGAAGVLPHTRTATAMRNARG